MAQRNYRKWNLRSLTLSPTTEMCGHQEMECKLAVADATPSLKWLNGKDVALARYGWVFNLFIFRFAHEESVETKVCMQGSVRIRRRTEDTPNIGGGGGGECCNVNWVLCYCVLSLQLSFLYRVAVIHLQYMYTTSSYLYIYLSQPKFFFFLHPIQTSKTDNMPKSLITTHTTYAPATNNAMCRDCLAHTTQP